METDTDCDSLDFVEFIMECEKEFNIEIPDDASTGIFYSLPIKKMAEYIYNRGGSVSSEVEFEFKRKQAESAVHKTVAKAESKPSQPKAQPKKATNTKPIELVKKDNKTIEFRQNGKVINLDNPQISSLIIEMTSRLQGIER